MKGTTVSLMVLAILVPLGITLSLLLVSYTSSCTLINYGEAAPSAGEVGYGGRLRLSWCWKLLLAKAQSPRTGGEGEGAQPAGWQPEQEQPQPQLQHMSFSDVRHERVKAVRIEASELVELRAASPEFDLSDPKLHQVLRLVKSFTQGWAPVQGLGGRVRSAWSVRHLRDALSNNSFMACCAHFRVVGGEVFFRYGPQVMKVQFRLDRANDAASFLQATLDRFRLRDVRVEFLLNTCDHALAQEAMASGRSGRANYLVWTPHVTEELDADLVVPDLLDLRPAYMQSRDEMEALRAHGRRWQDKIPRAVFRGATTNFWLRRANWGSSPRLRLHRMTDGGLGGGRLCDVLLTQRALILQDSPFIQFFYPLLKKGRHFMETDHHFQDLPEVLEYMQAHDGEMREMVERAHREVGWTCSIDGRMLAFAVILVRYHGIQDPLFYTTGVPDRESVELIQAPRPEQRCPYGPATEAGLYRDFQGSCASRPEPRMVALPGCPSDCGDGLPEPDWRWLAAHDLDGVAGTDWWKTYIPQS